MKWDRRPCWPDFPTPEPTPAKIRTKVVGKKRKRRKSYPKHRLRLFEEQKQTCRYCNEVIPWKQFTVDHVLPRALGGGGKPENLVGACKLCNNRKADKHPDEWEKTKAAR